MPSVSGQEKIPAVSSLLIGQQFPDRSFNMLNYKTERASISDFKGKLVILDYWATWCTICIAGMPKMHELQQKFGDQIQIILVNYNEDRGKVERFIKKREKLNSGKINLPVLYGDSILCNVLLKPPSIPHFFWIDRNGVYRNETLKFDVNEANIESFLKKESISTLASSRTEQSKDLLSDLRNALFKRVYHYSDSSVLWYSKLARNHKSGSPVSTVLTDKNGFSGLVSVRNSMLDLYRFAFGSIHTTLSGSSYIESIPITHTMLERPVVTKYGMHFQNYKQPDSLFSYQLLAPLHSSTAQMQRTMRAELAKWFGFSGKVELRKVKCLSFTATDTTKFAYYKRDNELEYNDTEFTVGGKTLDEVIKTIEENIVIGFDFLPPYPLLNDTGYKGLVHFELENVNSKDYKSLNRALTQFGLQLKLVEREIEVLVVYDVVPD